MRSNRAPPFRQAPYAVPNIGQGYRGRADFRAGGPPLSMYPQPVHQLRPIPLPFYDVVGTILPPMKLTANDGGMRRLRKEVLQFAIPQEYVTDLKYTESTKPLPRREVQLRFFFLGTDYHLTEQMDEFPHQATVRINENCVNLPPCIPTNKPNTEPKRPSRPVDITQSCQPSRDGSKFHRMVVDWLGDGRTWAVAVYVVNHVDADILKERILCNPNFTQPSMTTKDTIMRRLGGSDEEITMDQLKISLLCPLGRTRMTVPARGKDCTHLQCFDLDLYLKMNEKRPTWKCAVCSCLAPYSKLIIDDYFYKMLADVGNDISEVELLKDGSYQVIHEEDSGDEPKSPLQDVDGSGDTNKTAAKKAAVPDDDIIVLDSDDENEQIGQAIKASMADSGVVASPKRNKEIEIICLDDTPPRNSQPVAQNVSPIRISPIRTASPPVDTSASAASASSSHSATNGNQQTRPAPYQQMMHELNNQGYNYHANWGIRMNQPPPQQPNHFQRPPPGGFIGGNVPQGGYGAPPPYLSNQMGPQHHYGQNRAPPPPPPPQNLANLLQNLSASYNQHSYNPR